MAHPHLARRDSSLLVVVDVQEPFLRRMPDRDGLVANLGTLVRVAHLVGVPVLVTEQYPEKLGPTAAEVRRHLEELGLYRPIAKLAFSCCGDEAFVEAVGRTRRQTVVLAGIEAHVCVQQTALDLLDLGLTTHVVADAVASRRPHDRAAALEKLQHAGAVITTTEMVAYELLGRAGTPEFKASMDYLRW